MWGQGAQCSSLYGAFLNPSGSFNWISVCVCVCVQLGRPALCVVALCRGRSSSVCCRQSEHHWALSLCVYVRTCEWIRVGTLSLPQWHVSQGESLWLGRRGCCVFSASSSSSGFSSAPPAIRDLFLCSGNSATGQYVPRWDWDGKTASLSVYVCRQQQGHSGNTDAYNSVFIQCTFFCKVSIPPRIEVLHRSLWSSLGCMQHTDSLKPAVCLLHAERIIFKWSAFSFKFHLHATEHFDPIMQMLIPKVTLWLSLPSFVSRLSNSWSCSFCSVFITRSFTLNQYHWSLESQPGGNSRGDAAALLFEMFELMMACNRIAKEDALSTCHASLHKRRLRNICLDSWLLRRARGSGDDGREEEEEAGWQTGQNILDFRYYVAFILHRMMDIESTQ